MVNGLFIQPINSLDHIFNSTYGIYTLNTKQFTKRFEVFSENSFLNEKEKLSVFINYMYTLTPEGFSLNEYKNINILTLDFLTSYRGYRHARGLPVRGQRTWTNGWSTHKSNTYLRNTKLFWAQKFFGGFSSYDVKLCFLGEQNNLFWKTQWRASWMEARKSRFNKEHKNKANALKIDIHSMANGTIFLPTLKRELTKKEKATYDKSTFAIGYDVGFSKVLLKEIARNQNLDETQMSNVSLLAKKKPRRGRVLKKKSTDTKAKLAAHQMKKKKKKTAWE